MNIFMHLGKQFQQRYWTVSESHVFIYVGDRLFPPVTGLSYSTWICVERYSEARTDPHPVRLLTLVRTSSKEQHLVCLVLLLSARDKSIIVSTMETPLTQGNFIFLMYECFPCETSIESILIYNNLWYIRGRMISKLISACHLTQ